MPVPDKSDLKRFCEIDGWEETDPNSPDHHRYKTTLDTGEILRTRVSHGRSPACDDPALWHRIRRHRLGLESEDEFWETARTGSPPTRGAPEPEPHEPSIPAWLADYLIPSTSNGRSCSSRATSCWASPTA